MVRTALALVALVVLSSCQGWLESEEADLRHLVAVEPSNARGRIRVSIPIDEGETAMLFTADPVSPHKAVFLEVRDPDGEVVFDVDTEVDSGRLKTGARYTTSVVSLNWPVTASDVPLAEGRWRAELGVVDLSSTFARGIDTQLDVLVKRDPDLTSGSLRVKVIFAGATRDDAELHDAMDDAVATWTALYEGIGLSLDVEYGETDLQTLPTPGNGAEEYIAVSSDVELPTVPVVVVPSFEDQPGIYGVAGGIPGPLVPSQRSAVVISSITNSGPDLVFDAQERRLLGETLGHEVLHYLGLFHPVEPSWDTWDALDDTPECESQFTCVRDLGENLMFPFPVCTGGDCIVQDALTEDQGGVAHRYAGVR